jgi:glycerol-3-phosphate acyltransferase PlsX
MVTHTAPAGRIAVDAMGGDLGPAEVVAAVKLALTQYPSLSPLTLVGDQAVLDPLLREAGLTRNSRLAVLHASEVVTMDDKPVLALKKKKDSSMVRAIELVKSGEAGAVVSCGNTGALMAAGTIKLRPMDGLDRPALGAICPREGGHFVLIDAGANPEARPEHLVHNAIVGSHYCRVRLGVKSPRVGLMTIGTEEGKGNALISGAHDLLRRTGDLINYTGPIEGFNVFTRHDDFEPVDVVVCDGFVGNIMLKSWESLVLYFKTMLKEELNANPLRQTGALLSKGAFNAFKERVNPERYSGAPLLGLNGNIIKAHGSSNRRAIKSAIHAANDLLKADMNQHIVADIARANEQILSPVA